MARGPIRVIRLVIFVSLGLAAIVGGIAVVLFRGVFPLICPLHEQLPSGTGAVSCSSSTDETGLRREMTVEMSEAQFAEFIANLNTSQEDRRGEMACRQEKTATSYAETFPDRYLTAVWRAGTMELFETDRPPVPCTTG